MSHQLHRLALAFAAAFLAIAAGSGYWGLLRRDALLNRNDNPRRVLAERRVKRGTIYDRNGAVLAESVGGPGSYARTYPYPEVAPVVGYVSAFYGSAGIESAADGVLHGDAGRDNLSVYWQDVVLGTPSPGRDVRLSLDLNLQRAADTALAERTGAVVLVDARTGEILAIASHPTFDPNHVDAQWEEIVADPRALLFNRATLALYPPGAAIEPFILAAGLEAGFADLNQIDPLATAPVPAAQGFMVNCRVPTPAAPLALSVALAYGCPHPFAELGRQLGADRLERLFTDFRFYEAPAIDIPAVASPGVDLGREVSEAAIGQGSLIITPLHLALAAAALANDGEMPAPWLLVAEQDAAGVWQTVPPADHPIAALPPEFAQQAKALITDGHSALAFSDGGDRAMAWFTGYAPSENSRYSVAVILEDGDVDAASLIGRRVLEAAVALAP